MGPLTDDWEDENDGVDDADREGGDGEAGEGFQAE